MIQMSCDTFNIEEPKGGDMMEILDAILPPREWEENGVIWTQYVS